MTKREEGKDTGQGQRAFGASLANAATPPTPPPAHPPVHPPAPHLIQGLYNENLPRARHSPGVRDTCVNQTQTLLPSWNSLSGVNQRIQNKSVSSKFVDHAAREDKILMIICLL